MMNSKEILEILQNCPQGYLKSDNILFKENNLYLLQTYKKLGAITSKDEFFNDSLDNSNNKIFCNVFSCSAIFDNISSFQSHYNVMHRFICSECKKSLPTEHFLDLHISEHHDTYFLTRTERGELLFKCYLEECKEIFANAHERKEHCIKHHKFPSNFRFDQVHKHSQHKEDKKCEKNSDQVGLAVEGAFKPRHYKKEFKTFSFGHQKEKTFRSKIGPKQNTVKTLEDMSSLKQALESV